MINLHFQPERMTPWLLNAMMLGFLALELAVIAYIIYLI